MVDENIVNEVYRELRALKDEAERGRENPIVVRIIDVLLRLTRLDAGEPETAQESAEENPEGQSEPAKGPCKHEHLSTFGRCQSCGECQHTNVRAGTCLTCDKEIEPE